MVRSEAGSGGEAGVTEGRMEISVADPNRLELRLRDGARLVLAEPAAKVVRLVQEYRPDIFAGVGSSEHLADVLALICYQANPTVVGSIAQFRRGLALHLASCRVE